MNVNDGFRGRNGSALGSALCSGYGLGLDDGSRGDHGKAGHVQEFGKSYIDKSLLDGMGVLGRKEMNQG